MASYSPFKDKAVRLSALACAIGFGGFVLWSAVAKLDEGVTASGKVVVQSDRKLVQHLEGGMVSEIFVREGESVEQGQVLLELAPIQSESRRDELAQEYAVQTATFRRLSTLLEDGQMLDLSELDEIEIDEPTRDDIVTNQRALFDQQRTAREASRSVLMRRKSVLDGRERDLRRQIEASNRALETARSDLALRTQLLSEKLETVGNVSQVQREVARLESDMSRLVGERNETRETARQVTEEIAEADAKFRQEVNQQLVEAQSARLSAREKLLAMDDMLARTTVRAPQSGTILNMAQSTIGGVVAPGEVIMEIVPLDDDLIVSVQLTPTDRDAVHPGQEVEAQLSAYKSFIAPRLPGEVTKVSADIIQDETTGAYYYEARVKLDASGLDPSTRIEILPGMPVDTFIASGTARTFLDYVFEPILTTIQKGTRMS